MIAGNRRTWSSGAAEPATRAQFFPNWPITFDNGNLVAADSHSTSTSLHTSVRLVPARSGSFFGIAMKAGHLYRIAGNGQLDFSGNGTPARRSGIGQISALAADLHGNLVIGDRDNFRILVVAARTGTFYGRAMTTGRIYSIAGNGDYHYSGHGGPAVKAGIEPGPVRVDQHGNVITGQSPRNPGRRQSHRHLLRRRHDRGRHLHPSPATATTTTPATAARPWTPSSRGSAASRETAPTGCWSRTCTGYG